VTPSPFHPSNPYPSTRNPVYARNVVATSHPLAAQAGLSMLARGGNAVDAAIATAAAMTIVEPVSNGLGSDAFALVWDGRELQGLNASGPAPAAWTPDYFARKQGADKLAPPMRGWDSVTVPGAVGAWMALHKRLGKLPFADLMAPAIDIAQRGYAVPVVVASKWAAAAALLHAQPGYAQAFMPGGRAPAVGERFAFAEAARTLTLIANTGGEAFYRGEVAAAMAAHAKANGGAMTQADLAAYQPQWVKPISRAFKHAHGEHVLHEIPPNGQGIAALMALGMAQHLGVGDAAVDTVSTQHRLIEAMKLAFADVYRFVSEPASMTVDVAQLLDDAYLAKRAALVDTQRAQPFAPGNPVRGGTIYLTAADERGMMVSFIQSNYMGFGSGVVVPGYGVSLQNRGHGFSLDAASPNVVAPGKRPFQTIIPAFVTHADGSPAMSFGVMGGNMQPQGHLQTLVRMLAYQQNPQAACDAPRWRFDKGLDINVEAHTAPEVAQGLAALGHRLTLNTDSYMDFGAGQFIWRLGGPKGDPSVDGYIAASDPRRDGQAVGF
jgi:gamma-glutamyltranspeptidase / glutathione hydrolase